MNTESKSFDNFVRIFVVIVGAGFGLLAGLVYSQTYFWAGVPAGAISGYHLANYYLKKLDRMSKQGCEDKKILLSGTGTAVLCGIACTVIIHLVMYLVSFVENEIFSKDSDLMELGIFLIVIGVAIIIGVVVAFIVGGLCTVRYISKVKGKESQEQEE